MATDAHGVFENLKIEETGLNARKTTDFDYFPFSS